MLVLIDTQCSCNELHHCLAGVRALEHLERNDLCGRWQRQLVRPDHELCAGCPLAAQHAA